MRLVTLPKCAESAELILNHINYYAVRWLCKEGS